MHLLAIERPAVHRYRTGTPTQPARVVWGVVIRRDPDTLERHDLPPDVYRALARDGGGPIRPMGSITARRLNAAVREVGRTS